MIKLGEPRLINFIEFLNVNWPTKEDVMLMVLYGFDHVEVGEAKGWAVYCHPKDKRGKRVIAVAGGASETVRAELEIADMDSEEDIILESIAHEYCHHIQHCRERQPTKIEEAEQEAEEFAKKAMEIWRNSPKYRYSWPGMAESCRKWLEGCTCADEGEPDQCKECTDAFLDHIKNIGRKDEGGE